MKQLVIFNMPKLSETLVHSLSDNSSAFFLISHLYRFLYKPHNYITTTTEQLALKHLVTQLISVTIFLFISSGRKLCM